MLAVVAAAVVAGVLGPAGALAVPADGGGSVADADATTSQHDAVLQDGGRHWVGQTLLTEAFDPGDSVDLLRANGDFVSDVVVRDNGKVFLDTDRRSPGNYVLTDGDTEIEFQLIEHEYVVTASRTQVSNTGTDTTVDFAVESNRDGYEHVISSPGVSAATLRDAFGTGSLGDPDGDGTDELVVPGGTTEETLTADFEGFPTGEVRIDFGVADSTGNDSVTLRVGSRGSARLVTPTVVEETGDVAAITVGLTDTSRATLYVGSRARGYLARTTVVDRDDDGRVTVRWNTYRAGHGAESAAFSASGTDRLQGVTRITGELAGDVRLEGGSYRLNVTVGDRTTDEGAVTLEPASAVTREVTVGTAGARLSASQVPDRVGDSSTVAKGDYVVLQIAAGGLFGYVDSANALAEGVEGVSLDVRETDASSDPNQPPDVVDVSRMAFATRPDANTVYVFAKTDRPVYETGDEFRVTFTVDAANPYVRDTREVSTTFAVAERRAQFRVAGDRLRLPAAADRTIRGTTTVADGTSLTVTLRSGEGAFSRSTVVNARGGQFNATFDLSSVSPGTSFTARIQEGGTTLDRVEGTVTEVPSVSVSDQETGGRVVEVDSAYLPDGGYIVVHDADRFDGESGDSVLGIAGYLGPGERTDVNVALDRPVSASTEVVVAVHEDDGNRTFDFVRTDGRLDRPYRMDGAAVSATASLTVGGTTRSPTTTTSTPTTTTTSTPTTTTTTTVVTPPTSTPSDGTTTDDGDDDGDDGDGGGLLPTPGFGVPAVLAALAAALLLGRALDRRDG